MKVLELLKFRGIGKQNWIVDVVIKSGLLSVVEGDSRQIPQQYARNDPEISRGKGYLRRTKTSLRMGRSIISIILKRNGNGPGLIQY